MKNVLAEQGFELPIVLDAMRFPVREQICVDESGQGYVLRMAALNGLAGLPEVKKLLLCGTAATLDERYGRIFSHWFGASPDHLTLALGSTSYTHGRATFYGGYKLSRPTFVNRTQPRVCPQCIRDDGICKLSWDFSLVTVCHKHRQNLVDCCLACAKPIKWDRPDVNICSCYSPLYESQNFHVPQVVEFEFAHWVQLRIQSKSFDEILKQDAMEALSSIRPTSALMKMLTPLSLDAGMLITQAFSAASGQAFDMPETSRRKLGPLPRAQVALFMAEGLAQRIQEQNLERLHLKSSAAVVDLIATCIAHDFTLIERCFAHSLLATVIGQYKAQRWSSPAPQLSQMTFF